MSFSNDRPVPPSAPPPSSGTSRSEGATPQAMVCAALLDVAPDLSPEELDREADLQLDLGLDSIDLVNVARAIAARTGVDIPEVDYASLRRVGDLADYVESHHGDVVPT